MKAQYSNERRQNMGQLLEIVSALHGKTQREYLPRMMDDKVICMRKAKEYESDYWDGERRYGYGGYKYLPGRWKSVAQALIDHYGLKAGDKVLDVGCGKAFLLYEMQLLIPELQLVGFDVSAHGLADCHPDFSGTLFQHRAEDAYPFADQEFDLVISLATLHNLRLFELQNALAEVTRVSRRQYVMLESYRNEQELFNLQCWALTAESFLHTDEWIWLYDHFGYRGDYEFIYFE